MRDFHQQLQQPCQDPRILQDKSTTSIAGSSAVVPEERSTYASLREELQNCRPRHKEYDEDNGVDDEEEEECCPICLEALDQCETCTLVCGHEVCMEHLGELECCPLCRHPLDDDTSSDEQHPQENTRRTASLVADEQQGPAVTNRRHQGHRGRAKRRLQKLIRVAKAELLPTYW